MNKKAVSQKIVLIAVISFAVLLIIIAAIFLFSGSSAECGNNACESEENCTTCATDCGACPASQPSRPETKPETTEPNQTPSTPSGTVCGDDKCDFGEDQWICCKDCPCTRVGMGCNLSSKSCEYPAIQMNLSNEAAISVVQMNLSSEGMDPNAYQYNVSTFLALEGTPLKEVCYTRALSGALFGGCFAINDAGQIVNLRVLI